MKFSKRGQGKSFNFNQGSKNLGKTGQMYIS